MKHSRVLLHALALRHEVVFPLARNRRVAGLEYLMRILGANQDAPDLAISDAVASSAMSST